MEITSSKRRLFLRTQRCHARLPYLRRMPLPAIGIITLLIVINVLAWIVAGIVLHFNPTIVSTAVLSYTLGLRHALDADHISAIDLMTRRLVATGQRPVTVGTFFSLGHSTIVIITSIVVAATATAVSDRFDAFGSVGGIVGSSVSAAFLILLGIMNAYILYKLIVQLRKVLHLSSGQESQAWKIEGGGCLFTILRGMFKLIDRPWKMYPLGVLFGMGFDTSSEIALLGISAIQAAKGTSIWLIMVFPFMFTVGMCLVDTIDGALMLTVYVLPMDKVATSDGEEAQTRAQEGQGNRRVKDPLTFLYYSIVLTTLTVVVALVIGVIQLLTMVLNVAEPSGRFWNGVESAGEHYDLIGGMICASFAVFGGLSILLYQPWRRRVERYRNRIRQQQEIEEHEEQQEGIVAFNGSTGIVKKNPELRNEHLETRWADTIDARDSDTGIIKPAP